MGITPPATGGHYQPLRIDVNLAIRYGKIYSVSVLHGTRHGDIDKAIVKWIQANWETYPWFAGGDSFAISMNVDPGIRQVVFRKT
jgi:type IV secretory pathway TrbD component